MWPFRASPRTEAAAARDAALEEATRRRETAVDKAVRVAGMVKRRIEASDGVLLGAAGGARGLFRGGGREGGGYQG